ncbi:hypothetical protein [Microvirga puerhi]|uniref:Response regulatory domain-containing protein n=1 Tax=Microvirga puerhi TaxID=2876078 RepID=A0ABS7VHU6_9HYPH|nr:hypothetical protein [Microvirga puerhi]MBZ6074731.1 hypothetical protein [Microvirga puerhi]
MGGNRRVRILVADSNPIFRETVAQRLRAEGYDAITAATGEGAFIILRDWQSPVDWLYARAGLPVLIDGWILADEYHDAHPTRPAVIAAPAARPAHQGDIVLAHPSPAAVLGIIREIIRTGHGSPTETDADHQRHAA